MRCDIHNFIQPVLILGRILGFTVPNQHGEFPKSRVSRYLYVVFALVMPVYYIAKNVLWFENIRSQLVEPNGKVNIRSATVFFWGYPGILSYIWIFFQRFSMSKFLVVWQDLRINSAFPNFNGRKAAIAIVFIIFSTFLETIFWDIKEDAVRIRESLNFTFLENYIDKNAYSFKIVGDNATFFKNTFFMIFTYVCSKIATFAFIYSDILCILFSSLIVSRLQTLNSSLRIFHDQVMFPSFWCELHREIIHLRQFAEKISVFLSPLIFCVLSSTIPPLLMRVDAVINPSVIVSMGQIEIYFNVVAVLHYTLRVVCLVHFLSEVRQHSEHMIALIENLQITTKRWTGDTEPVMAILRRKPVEIVLWNTIAITRKFYLSILSLMLTLEIVLLQATS